MVPAFRYWFLGRLGLPPNCVLYPPQTTNGMRPDLVAVTPDGVAAWIEIELGGEDAAQMAAYHQRFDPQPIKCIVGRQDQGSDLSLEELSLHLGSALRGALDEQQRMNAQLFIDLVTEGLHGKAGGFAYVAPAEVLRANEFVAMLRESPRRAPSRLAHRRFILAKSKSRLALRRGGRFGSTARGRLSRRSQSCGTQLSEAAFSGSRRTKRWRSFSDTPLPNRSAISGSIGSGLTRRRWPSVRATACPNRSSAHTRRSFARCCMPSHLKWSQQGLAPP